MVVYLSGVHMCTAQPHTKTWSVPSKLDGTKRFTKSRARMLNCDKLLHVISSHTAYQNNYEVESSTFDIHRRQTQVTGMYRIIYANHPGGKVQLPQEDVVHLL